MRRELCDMERGTVETSAIREHSWMPPSFHQSVLPLNCTFRCRPFPTRRAKCTFNTRAKPFDSKGKSKESIAVVLRSQVAMPFGATRTETISTGARKRKNRKRVGNIGRRSDCTVHGAARSADCHRQSSALKAVPSSVTLVLGGAAGTLMCWSVHKTAEERLKVLRTPMCLVSSEVKDTGPLNVLPFLHFCRLKESLS